MKKIISDNKIIENGKFWDEDRFYRLRKWAKTGWILSGVFLFLFILTIIAALGIWVKMSAPISPAILAVDHATGEVQVLETFGTKTIDSLTMTHKLFAANYVQFCERYIPQQLNNDYATCADMSEGDALKKYQHIFEGDDGRNKVLKNLQTWTIEIISVQLPTDARGIAIVRFKKNIYVGGSKSSEGFFIARFAYRFTENPKGTEREKISNPFSYKVSSYSVDAEIGASAIPSVQNDTKNNVSDK